MSCRAIRDFFADYGVAEWGRQKSLCRLSDANVHFRLFAMGCRICREAARRACLFMQHRHRQVYGGGDTDRGKVERRRTAK